MLCTGLQNWHESMHFRLRKRPALPYGDQVPGAQLVLAKPANEVTTGFGVRSSGTKLTNPQPVGAQILCADRVYFRVVFSMIISADCP